MCWYGKWAASPLCCHSWIQAESAASPCSRHKKRSEGGGCFNLKCPNFKAVPHWLKVYGPPNHEGLGSAKVERPKLL